MGEASARLLSHLAGIERTRRVRVQVLPRAGLRPDELETLSRRLEGASSGGSDGLEALFGGTILMADIAAEELPALIASEDVAWVDLDLEAPLRELIDSPSEDENG